MAKLDEVKEWIKKAAADYEGSVQLSRRKKKPLPDLVCFHCQQCAEKCLKGFLIYHQAPFPKTHDLLLLLDLCIPFQLSLEMHRELFEFLNPYSVVFRYPGEETTVDEAKTALIYMKKVWKIFNTILPVEFKT